MGFLGFENHEGIKNNIFCVVARAWVFVKGLGRNSPFEIDTETSNFIFSFKIGQDFCIIMLRREFGYLQKA